MPTIRAACLSSRARNIRPTLAAFDGIALLEDAAAPEEIADLMSNVNSESELSLNADQTHVMRIVEAAVNGDETLDDIVADWNEAWNAAVDEYAPAK